MSDRFDNKLPNVHVFKFSVTIYLDASKFMSREQGHYQADHSILVLDMSNL